MAESDLIYQEKLEKVFSKVQPDQRTSFPYSRFPEIHKFILKNAAEHMGECVKPPFPVVAEIGCGPQPGIIQDIQHEIFKLHAKSSDIADLKKAVDKCTDFVRAKVLSGVDILRLEKLLDKDERNYLWGGFNYHKGSAEHLPLDTKSHDLLVYPFVLSYTNKEDSVEEMKRVLKKDGRVIVLAHAKKTPILSIDEEIEAIIKQESDRAGIMSILREVMKERGKKGFFIPDLIAEGAEVEKRTRENTFESGQHGKKFFEAHGFKVEKSITFPAKKKNLSAEEMTHFKKGYDTIAHGYVLRRV